MQWHTFHSKKIVICRKTVEKLERAGLMKDILDGKVQYPSNLCTDCKCMDFKKILSKLNKMKLNKYMIKKFENH